MTQLQFDAYSALRRMQERYTAFLLDQMGVRDLDLRERLTHLWTTQSDDAFPLFAPLQIEPVFPFVPGPLLEEADLHRDTIELLRRGGIDYPLYKHQGDAIKAANAGKTVIVSAGTGSGKTEAFLFPILDRLLRDHAEGRDDLRVPGVRALIVYPLNALVNNQVARIRRLLQHQELLTFAFYTSRLPTAFKDARNRANSRGGRLEPRCQIFDRRTLRGVDHPPEGRPCGPPHLLVTNFSMLEYMLVRPDDRPIFAPSNLFTTSGAPRLKAIVLDEAHVYAGAQAAEIHLLLRRAAMRFGTTLEAIQGYATSATLSSDGDPSHLKRFAAEIFSKRPTDVAAIVGRRHLHGTTATQSEELTLRPPQEIPKALLTPPSLRTLKYDADGNPVGFVLDSDACEEAAKWLSAYGVASDEALRRMLRECNESPASLLHAALSQHPKVKSLREWLFDSPQILTVDDVARQLFDAPASDRSRRATLVLLCLCSLARTTASDHPILPARLHAFVRAPTGAWSSGIDPESVGDLIATPGEPTAATIVTCRSCGLPWFEAWLGRDDWGDETWSNTPRSDAEHVAIRPATDSADSTTSYRGTPVEARPLVSDTPFRLRQDQPCPRCGDARGTLHTLGFPAAQSIGPILDALFPFLAETGGSGFRPGGGRRLLTFSDSRREAAKLAAQLEETHDRGLNRQIIWRHLKHAGEAVTIGELAMELSRRELRERAIFAEHDGQFDDGDFLDDVALLGCYEEFARPPRRGDTLETLGLVEVIYPGLPVAPPSVPRDVWEALLTALLDEARRRGVVARPRFQSRDPFLFAELLPDFIDRALLETTSAEDKVVAWRTTRRDSPTSRIVDVVAADLRLDPTLLSRMTWEALTGSPPRFLQKRDGGWRIRLERLQLRARSEPPYFDRGKRPHVRRFSHDALSAGGLHPADASDIETWRNSHAVRRVTEDEPLGMWTIEHTAQIDPELLEQQEQRFVRGERNVLASSTTMEMGVDVGGLTFVLLGNVPPSPANYLQRAGRAGRRADGSSLVLTVALERPHDQKAFRDIGRYLSQPIVPPRVRLDARRLVQRHLHSLLLTLFFDVAVRTTSGGNPMASFGQVRTFFVDPIEPNVLHAHLAPTKDARLVDVFRGWLRDEALTHAAGRLRSLVEGTILEQASDEELIHETDREISTIDARLRHDLTLISKLLTENEEATRDEKLRDNLERQRRRMESEYLIRFLTRNDFLPRFGFPIDVVHLTTTNRFERRDDEEVDTHPLRLERDLTIALGEYVPGSDVVANKRVYSSAGIVRNWELDTLRPQYLLVCRGCGDVDRRDAPPTACSRCGHPATIERRGATAGDETPSAVQLFFEPAGFAVAFSDRPRRFSSRTRIERLPPPSTQLRPTDPTLTAVCQGLRIAWSPHSTLFSVSRGREQQHGFAICQVCGFAQPEKTYGGMLPKRMKNHVVLRGAKTCLNDTKFWRNVALGTTMHVDALLVSLGDEAPPASPAALLTLAMCLRHAASRILRVDPRTLSSTVCKRPGDRGRAAAVVEESGAGYLETLGEAPDELVRELRDIVFGPESDLLRFDTQYLFQHGVIDVAALRSLLTRLL